MQRRIPHCLSTAASTSIEACRARAGDNAWFQLYVSAAPAQDHRTAEIARHLLVGGKAVADQERSAHRGAEQRLRNLGATRGVDVEADRVLADSPQGGRSALPPRSPTPMTM